MPLITFLNPTRDSANVSAYSRKVLEDILKKSGVVQITITSTARSVQDQARIMYENIEQYGVNHQKKLYASAGDSVVDEYALLKSQGKSKAEIISGLILKITSVGPGNVSRHVGNLSKMNVVDIAPSSINFALRKKFELAVKSGSRVSKLITPPADPAYHLEIPQP